MSLQLSGLWGGRYWYTQLPEDAVPFSAWLSVLNGNLTGSILEPNTILIDGPEELSANIVGSVAGDHVEFSKTYPLIDQPNVVYDGRVDKAGSRISGTWRFPDYFDYSGRFEMTRMSATTKQNAYISENVQ